MHFAFQRYDCSPGQLGEAMLVASHQTPSFIANNIAITVWRKYERLNRRYKRSFMTLGSKRRILPCVGLDTSTVCVHLLAFCSLSPFVYLRQIHNGAISAGDNLLILQRPPLTCEWFLHVASRRCSFSKCNQPWWGRQKGIRSRDQGHAQQGGDWFAVHAVSGIIGVGNTVARVDALWKKKKKSLAISAERSLWNWKSCNITEW